MGRSRVSIHAPAWGATVQSIGLLHVLTVSIHAPAWGATGNPPCWRDTPCFNPRARVGRDPYFLMSRRAMSWFQSTRPRGARPGSRIAQVERRYSFNPRARVGRDFDTRADALQAAGFNPRARVGRDPNTWHALVRQDWFQSTRPRGARRPDARRSAHLPPVSIHAPAWGATRRCHLPCQPCEVSIHAPAWGATRPRVSLPAPEQVSIHAPAWGATPEKASLPGHMRVSIHAPAWGATTCKS